MSSLEEQKLCREITSIHSLMMQENPQEPEWKILNPKFIKTVKEYQTMLMEREETLTPEQLFFLNQVAVFSKDIGHREYNARLEKKAQHIKSCLKDGADRREEAARRKASAPVSASPAPAAFPAHHGSSPRHMEPGAGEGWRWSSSSTK
tara:strand:- start:120 stop:566 length:447 start_codon:yes stop_codon:yes gene_type:complete